MIIRLHLARSGTRDGEACGIINAEFGFFPPSPPHFAEIKRAPPNFSSSMHPFLSLSFFLLPFVIPVKKGVFLVEGEYFTARDFSRKWINGKKIVRISRIQVYGYKYIDELPSFFIPEEKGVFFVEGEYFTARDFSREWINGKEIVRISRIQVYGDRRAFLS